MSTNTLTFGNTLLAQTGKKGSLSPMDDSGYYLMNAGMLNAPLRLGHRYVVNDYVMECMEPNSDLQRRVARGEVYAELGHPKPFYFEKVNGVVCRTPITEEFEWIMRLRTIMDDNVALHIRKIHFNMMGGRYDPVQLQAEVIPFGTHKQIAQDSLTNPDINTALSMRTVTAPQVKGRDRQIEYFTGVDLVWEPGEHTACKHLTAGCEQLLANSNNGMDIYDKESEFVVETEDLLDSWERIRSNPKVMERYAGMESFTGMESMMQRLAATRNTKHTLVRANSLNIF